MTAAALETDSETDSETKAATAIPQPKTHQPMHQPPIGAITASGRSRRVDGSRWAGGFRSRAMVRSVLGSLLGALVGLLAGTSGVVAQTLEMVEPAGTDPIDPETAIPAQAQVTSVSALSDVQPTDWAFQALQSLVERYGCLAGYPDGLFRGDRPLGRFEFAAGLAACLEAIQTQLDRTTDAAVQRDDLAALSRLQTEFRSELEQLTGRVNRLEATTARLESQRFSPTLLMGGETIFGLSAAAGDNPPGDNENPATFAHLTRLQFVTSFTGKDRLRLQLATGNLGNNGYASRQSLGTDMARLSFQTDLDNNIQLDLLDYRFAAWGDRVVLTLRPVGFDLSSVLTANSPFFDTGRGAISRFAEGSPLFKLAALDGGVGADWLLWERGRLQFAYGAGNSARSDQGIFGSDRSAWGVQLLTKPAATLLTGIAYISTPSPAASTPIFPASSIPRPKSTVSAAHCNGGYRKPSPWRPGEAGFGPITSIGKPRPCPTPMRCPWPGQIPLAARAIFGPFWWVSPCAW
jgi:hypothetical protein